MPIPGAAVPTDKAFTVKLVGGWTEELDKQMGWMRDVFMGRVRRWAEVNTRDEARIREIMELAADTFNGFMVDLAESIRTKTLNAN